MLPSAVAREARANVLDYLETTFGLSDEALSRELLRFLDGPEGIFRGPYLDVRLPFRTAGKDARPPLELLPEMEPYQHQLRAWERLHSGDGHQPQHTLVTTGTGSGKTECFLQPILDHCARERAAGKRGVKAVLLYPMNALATDQARRIAKTLFDDERLKGVEAGLYVGGKGSAKRPTREVLVDDRGELRRSPPDILLTNYRMLDFLLLRPDDQVLWAHNGPETLRYLVLDELHTYDGAQGSDVACLIRRLKERLGTPKNGLTFVGTSATIGEGDFASKQRLTKFASLIADERLTEESVIVEDRLTAPEALGTERSLDLAPGEDDAPALDPAGSEPDAWIKQQRRLWLGPDAEALGSVELGQQLARHGFLHDLIHVLGGQARELPEIARELGEVHGWFQGMDPETALLCVDSFTALISTARREVTIGGARLEVPFLTVQVQLWLREARGLVRAVDEVPRFAWRSERGAEDVPDDVPDDEAEVEPRYLPMVRCRDCGASGFATAAASGEARLLPDRRDVGIGRQWMERRPEARFVVLGHTGAEGEEANLYGDGKDRLCPVCLRFGDRETCGCQGPGTPAPVPVRVVNEVTTEGHPRFKPTCPDCGAEDSLLFVASRAASLMSVAVSHLYQSKFNGDKKLLAFVDAVQDASHRAGFFGARTYRFNLRTLIQGLIEARGGRLPLRGAGEALLAHTEATLGGLRAAIPVLMPEDLRGHRDYRAFLDGGGETVKPELREWLTERLELETTFEFGYSVRAGRSLERSGCASAFVDPGALAAVAEQLATVVEGDGLFGNADQPVDAAAVERFLVALLQRLRLRGGVHHGLLDKYVESGGARFMLSRHRVPTGPIFGKEAVLPRFLQPKAPSGAKRSAFDALEGAKPERSWYADLAARSFGILRSDHDIVTFAREALRLLTAAKILREVDAGKGRSVWGIDPGALTVAADPEVFTCSTCGGTQRFPKGWSQRIQGSPCHRYRCMGTYGAPGGAPETFYTRIFRGGQVARVFPEEHTGLLERQDRELIEQRFIDGSAPDGPNMLVATPTLEMGIDIGTLSAVMLCSVPPTTSMYLQRIGRAGRTTGNAFAFTMAQARPHDLHFHSDPARMMSGAVDPPGCFLDAPEMLKRQFVAFAMDSWARSDGAPREIPKRATAVLSKGSTFVESIGDHVEGNLEELLRRFLDCFRSAGLSDAAADEIRRFAGGTNVRARIAGAFEALREERLALKRAADRAQTRLKALQEDPDQGSEEGQRELRDVTDALKGAMRLHAAVGAKYPLNVLTDAGVLPNYAFPEPGVELDSVIVHRGKDGGKAKYVAHQYMRPASSALRELAPLNTFYAEGKRVRINEIDLGTRARPVTERWRFCAACMYAVSSLDEVHFGAAECPSCGDVHWNDSGRERTLVPFTRARAMTDRLAAATADDGDERTQERYDTLALIDVKGAKGQFTARVIEGLPFGFELFSELELHEVNFGPEGRGGFEVAGEAVNDRAFPICRDCKRVDDGRGNESWHAASCRARSHREPRIENVVLSRRVRSEAMRILLPVAAVELGRERASIVAALELGLRRRFGGSVAHIKTRIAHEPQGDGRRNYVVLFDSVPGGTGALLDLWRDDGVVDALAGAIGAMNACACDDGCYRCLFAYQNQRDLELTSKRAALKILDGIVSRRAELVDVDSLSGVSIDDRLESELEERFVRALAARAAKGGGARQLMDRGLRVWELRVGNGLWRVASQVVLGPEEGVHLHCRPDFLLIPMGTGMDARQVAVFCDGFRYHVEPDQPRARVQDDVAKRMAIAESDRYRVWSVTWDDVLAFEETDKRARQLDGALLDPDWTQVAAKVAERWGTGRPDGVHREGSMDGLWRYLTEADDSWFVGQTAAVACALLVQPTTFDRDGAERWTRELRERVEEPSVEPQPVRVARDIGRFHGGVRSAHVHLAADLPMNAIEGQEPSQADWTLRLFDHQEARRQGSFRGAWRAFLQASNVLQFSEALTMVTTEGIMEHGAAPVAAAAANEETVSMAAEGAGTYVTSEALDGLDLLEEERAVAEAVLEATGCVPEVGYTFLREDGAVGVEVALAWPDARVGFAETLEAADVALLQQRDWIAVDEAAIPEDVALEVARRLNSEDKPS